MTTTEQDFVPTDATISEMVRLITTARKRKYKQVAEAATGDAPPRGPEQASGASPLTYRPGGSCMHSESMLAFRSPESVHASKRSVMHE